MLRVVLGRKEGKEETRRRVSGGGFFPFLENRFCCKKREKSCECCLVALVLLCIMTLVALYYLYHYYSDDDDDDDDVVSLFSSTRRELEERNCSRHAELYNLSESCLKVVRLGFKSLPNPFLKPSFKIEVLSTTYYIRTHANPSQTTRST